MTVTSSVIGDFPAMQMVRTGRLVRFFGRLTFISLIASIVAMVYVPWQQTARGVGTVVALDPQERRQPVLSPSKGVISYVKEGLREGTFVGEGELVLRLTPFAADSVNQYDIQLATVEAKMENAKNRIANAEENERRQIDAGQRQVAALNEELEATRQKWEQAKNAITQKEASLEDKQNQLKVAEDVIQEGIIPQQELFTKQREAQAAYAALLEARSKADEVFRLLSGKENEIEAKKQDIDIKNRDAAQKVIEETQKLASIQKELSQAQNKVDELERLEVYAPRSGYIQELLGLAGSDTVKEGEPLFVIVPKATQLAVEMKVNGNDMPLIHVGDRVRLQFEGWPAVQFVGWPSVAVGTFGGKVNRIFPTDDGNGNFRVVVVEDNHFERENGWPKDRYLRQGVRANGWVLLKEVRLGWEIWRQLNGFPPTVSDSKAPKEEKAPKVKLPKV